MKKQQEVGDNAAKKTKAAASPYFVSTTTPHVHTVVGHGSCGASVVLDRMKKMEVEKNPHLHFLVLETNSRVLSTYFSQEACAGNAMLQAWMESGRTKIIQLGKGTGAGGDPDVGKELLTKRKEEIEEILKKTNTVIQVGGGGGGTASGAMPVMAQILKEKSVPLYSILTVPRLREGRKRLLRARDTMRKLLELCPTTFIYNEKILVDKTIPYSKIYGNINDTCLFPSFGVLHSLICDIGDVQDRDATDWQNFLQVGNHALPGFYDASGHEELEGMEEALLNNRYLNNAIIKKATGLIACFEGFSSAHVDEALDCLQSKMETIQQRDDTVDVKYSIKENVPEGKRSVSFVAFAKECHTPMLDDTEEEETKPPEQVFIPAEIPNVIPAIIPEEIHLVIAPRAHDAEEGVPFHGHGHGHKEEVEISGMCGGIQKKVLVPLELAADYNGLFRKDLGKADLPWAREVQRRIKEYTGFTFDVPILEAANQ